MYEAGTTGTNRKKSVTTAKPYGGSQGEDNGFSLIEVLSQLRPGNGGGRTTAMEKEI